MNEVMKTLETAAKADGYRAYKVNGSETYGYIITPKGNVLVVNKATWGDGVTFTLSYEPNRRCGSGCSCMGDDYDFGVRNVTVKGIEEYEQEGLRFAKELKAPKWVDAEQCMNYKREFYGHKLEEVA